MPAEISPGPYGGGSNGGFGGPSPNQNGSLAPPCSSCDKQGSGDYKRPAAAASIQAPSTNPTTPCPCQGFKPCPGNVVQLVANANAETGDPVTVTLDIFGPKSLHDAGSGSAHVSGSGPPGTYVYTASAPGYVTKTEIATWPSGSPSSYTSCGDIIGLSLQRQTP